MGDVTEVAAGVESVTVEATVIRADGTREELGVVAEWTADPPERVGPIRRAWRALTKEH